MTDVTGDFEIHLTVHARQAAELAAFAAEHGAGFVHIELDRGQFRSQPMLTVHGTGTLADQRQLVQDWRTWLGAAGFEVRRAKIEAAPWSDGVPQRDRQAPPGRYFEHHVKLRLPTPGVAELIALTDLVEPHGARLSRSARRRDPDGFEHRFVNQRCGGAGRLTATHRLDRLVTALRTAGYDIVSAEQEYVVHDDCLDLDEGWLPEPVPPRPDEAWRRRREDAARTARPGPAYPATYQPLARGRGVTQRGAFDPALKEHPNAYRAGEPVFADPDTGRRWRAARQAAMTHVLDVLAGTPWAGRLVLRGSATMTAWVGAAARTPGDLDFVVVPPTVTSDSRQARELLDGIVGALLDAPGAGLRPQAVTTSAIWTYERADGRRLVVPFGVAGAPDGTVQIDVVFGEELPLPPEPLTLPGVSAPVLAATAGLSLAWKLLWLATDRYPQGKDLYDAALLAEHTTVDLDLVRLLLDEEFSAMSVLSWHDVDWDNFADEWPGVEGTAEQWRRRLALALGRLWPPESC